jgi:hypothetical protein
MSNPPVNTTMTADLAAGNVVVWRDIFRGRIAFARPMRVVAADARLIVCALRAGTRCKMHSTYIRGERQRYVEDLATGQWSLQDAVWQSTDVLQFVTPGAWYSCCVFFEAETHRFLHWYVNFQMPVSASTVSLDTFDLCLDIVVSADGEWRWKDQDEFDRAIELGVISPTAQRGVRSAANEVIARIGAKATPFDGSWNAWRPLADEALPQLISGWDAAADADTR